MDAEERIKKALNIGFGYGSIDGSHHKMWVIDQMIRALTGEDYDRLVREFCNGEDGEDTYSWDCGVAP